MNPRALDSRLCIEESKSVRLSRTSWVCRTHWSLSAETAMAWYEIAPTTSRVKMADPNANCSLRPSVDFTVISHRSKEGGFYFGHDPDGCKRAACSRVPLCGRESNRISTLGGFKLSYRKGVE